MAHMCGVDNGMPQLHRHSDRFLTRFISYVCTHTWPRTYIIIILTSTCVKQQKAGLVRPGTDLLAQWQPCIYSAVIFDRSLFYSFRRRILYTSAINMLVKW